MKSHILLATSFGIAALVLLAPGETQAQAGPKVRPPSNVQVAVAKTGLDRGLVYQIESNPSGGLKQVTIYGLVNAPPHATFETLSIPDLLLKMQPAMDSVDVRAKQGNAVTYRWDYSGPMVTTQGLTAMALVPDQAVQWGLTKGFGPGTLLWRLYPHGDQTLVALSMHVDVSQSPHTLIRWVSGASPVAVEMWNLGHGILCMRGLQSVAAGRAGRPGLPPPTGEAGDGPMRMPPASLVRALAPLYQNGSAGIVEQDARGRVAQAVMFERVNAPADRVKQILGDISRWDAVLPDAISVEREDDGTHVMEISVPGLSVDTNIEVAAVADGADLTSPSGTLRNSLASFRVISEGNGSILTGACRFRARQGGRILRAMIDSDPYFGHGLNASALGIFVRGFKQGAEAGR
jgi:hypothetical protein